MNKNLLNSIELTRPKKNVFDLSHDVKLSLNMGQLVPIMCMEAIPGDKFSISCESLLRFAPLVSPVMHRMDVTMHYFFVPNRILWPQWEKYITNTKVAGILPAFPTTAINAATPSSYTPLMDYLGIPDPTGLPGSEIVSAMPLAAYQMIYNEYYRDQNLVTEVPFELIDGDNFANTELRELRIRAWEHDYFTASLPFAQKGDPVTLPITGTAMVKVNASPAIGETHIEDTNAWISQPGATGTTGPFIEREVRSGIGGNLTYADLDGSVGSNINDLRRAFRLQEWLEKAARGGSRYVENILIFFGLKSQDSRLQRPEYITGTKSPVIISEVLNTSDTQDAPQGNMAGHGISVTNGKYGAYFCQEHGYIMGIMSVLPRTAYQQGIPKHFLKTTDPFEFYWPPFANIGEQEVLNRELFAYQAGSAGADTFGYIPRYAEYKYQPSRVAGDFRTSLDFWHLGRIFASAPALNQAFIECVPDPRVFAVTDPAVQKLYVHVFNKVKAVRSMPKFGTPSF